MKKIFPLVLAMIIAISCFAAENVTTIFTVTPGMSCQNCETKIKSNLRVEKGVKNITTSLSDQIVKVTYDLSKTSEAMLIEAFKKIGYTASTAKAAHKCANGDKKYNAANACSSKQIPSGIGCNKKQDKKSDCCK